MIYAYIRKIVVVLADGTVVHITTVPGQLERIEGVTRLLADAEVAQLREFMVAIRKGLISAAVKREGGQS